VRKCQILKMLMVYWLSKSQAIVRLGEDEMGDCSMSRVVISWCSRNVIVRGKLYVGQIAKVGHQSHLGNRQLA